MADHPLPSPAGPDEEAAVDAGRRLIRLPDPPPTPFADRARALWLRAIWRTPLHKLHLKGQYPLRLVAAPVDPLPGDPAVGRALRAGAFTFRGHRLAIGTLDFARLDVTPPFADHLHSFAWLRDLSAAGERAKLAPLVEGIVKRWLAVHAEAVAAPAWAPATAAWRLLHWLTHAPLILSASDIVYRSAVLTHLARTARHLDRVSAAQPAGVSAVVVWSAVVAAGLLLPKGDARRTFGEAGLRAAVGTAFTDDGGNIARSPLGQMAAIEALAMLTACYAARRINPPDWLSAVQGRAVPALLAVVHGDGGLGSWQGAGAAAPETVRAVVGASGVRARPLKDSRDWGFQRLTAQKTVVVVDAAPPPLPFARPTPAGMEGGCASTGAFELSDGPHRLIVNCGGADLTGAWIPDELSSGLRSTAAHSTLVVADTNSTAILPSGALGKGVRIVDLDRREEERGSRLEVTHDGYAAAFGLTHRRLLILSHDGRELRGEDVLVPADAARGRRKGRRAGVNSDQLPVAVRFHLAPDVQAEASKKRALLTIPDGPGWELRAGEGLLAIEDSLWVDGHGRPHPSLQLVIHHHCPPGGAGIGWLLRRADQ